MLVSFFSRTYVYIEIVVAGVLADHHAFVDFYAGGYK